MIVTDALGRHGRGLRGALLLLLCFAFLSLAQERSAIFGIVRDAKTHQPIEGVRISLLPYDFRPGDPLFPTLRIVTDSSIGFATTTDAAGRYRYPDLPPHRYCLSWEKQGYWRDSFDPCNQSMFRTVAGSNVQRDLTLDSAPTLRGRFLDSSTNAPITGLQLTALQLINASGVKQWATFFGVNAGKGPGEFEMHQPPRGEFYLEIVPVEAEKIGLPSKPDTPEKPFYGRSYYPGVADIAQATPIVLVPGEDRFLEIRLPKQQPQTVLVEIVANGTPPDARIKLVLERRTVNFFPSTVATTFVDSRDPIELGGLSPADYTIVAWTSDGSAGRIGSVRRFSTTNRDTSNLKLDLEPTVTLRGVVRIDPASGSMPDTEWYLHFGQDGLLNQGGFSVKVKAGEDFKVVGLFPGQYHLYPATPPGWVVSRMAYGTADAVHQTVSLDNAHALVVTLSRAFGVVSGSLTDGAGPMDSAMVVLAPEPIPDNPWVNSFPWTHPDEDGHYEFKYVVPGHYRIIPFYGDTLDLYHELPFIRAHAKGYRDVTVLPGKTTTGINFASRR